MDLNDLAIELFCQFDPEKKGYITKDELLNVSNREGPFSEVQVLSIFSLLDKDDKGVITLTDFTDAFLDISDINEMSESDTIENDKIFYTKEEEYIADNKDSEYIHDNCDEYIDDNVTDFISENNYINENEHEYLNGNVRAYSSDEEVSDDHSDDIGTDDRYMDYQHYDNTNNDSHVDNYNEYESIKNNQNKCRTSSVNDDWFCKTRNLDDKQKSEFEDQYWWEYGNSINGFRINSAFFKRESLPSLKTTDIPRINDLKLSRKWKSCEAGINKCFIASNNKAFQLDKKNSLNTTHTRKRNLIKKLSNLKLNQLEQEYKKEKLVTKELDCIFGPKHKVATRAASCTCLDLDDQNQTKRTKKYMSQNSLNMYPTNRKVINRHNTILRTRSYRELDIDEKQDYLYRTADSIENINKYFKRRRSSSTPSENLSSINAEDGLYVSCESVLSPRENANEDWQSYLKRMQCVSLFGGNQSLRFIWQQIGSYQKELLIPLEDFLKSVVEEHKSVYTKCQDVENTLHMKIEQHEKEIDQLYEEFDRTTQRELDQIEKKHHEREEAIKTEYRKILEQKEQVHQENLKHTNEMSGRLNNYEAELGDLREDKKKLEDHLRQVVQEQQIIISESEQIVNENEVLKEKLTTCNGNIREIQDYLNQVTKDYEKEKVRHGTIMRRFKDLLEEKEFLEISLTAITTENEDLRNANKTHEENLDSSLILNSNKDGDLSSNVPPAMCSSPVADKKQPMLPHGLSLHEEMNALDFEVEMDALDHSNLLDNTYAEKSMDNDDINLKTELYIQESEKQPGYKIIITDENKNNNNHDLSTTRVFSPLEEIELPEYEKEEEDNLSLSSSLDDSDALKESIDNMVTSTPRKSMGIRFASAVQSEFKVILCGDAAVGKTNLIHRICFNKFSKKREITTQMDSYKKIVELDSSTIVLNLWDTCGQERYNSLPRSYYRKIDVAILVYDIADEVTFVNAKSWFKAIHDYTHENVLIILIGNKVDLKHRRRVTYAEGESLAMENDAIFVEASAKSAENISNIVTLIARTLLAQHEYVFIHNYFERTNILHDDKRLIEMKSRCC